MLVPSLVFYQRVLLRLLTGMITIVILSGATRVPVSYALGSSPFSLEPSFSGAYSSAPRAYFTYNTFPGAHTDDSIHITNGGLVRGTISLYPVDAITGQTSGTSVRPRNERQVDVGTWITLSQQHITLDPGQSIEVPFTLTVPLHVRPGQHGGIIMAEDMHQEQENIARSKQGSSATIGIQSFIGLGVLVNLPGPTVERLQATSIDYDQKSTHQRVLVALGNTGTQLLHPSGNLYIIDKQGRVLQNIPIAMDTFLPQTSIDYPVYIRNKAIPLGRSYTAKLHLTYEHNHVLNYTTSFYTPLPKKGQVIDVIQDLVTPPSGDIFSTLTPWHYVVGISALFLILSALFFWGQKIQKTAKRVLRKK